MRAAQKSTFARRLRRGQTDVERKLWYELRDRRLFGLKFRRQAPIGPYVVDFACVDLKLLIELDGGQHDPEKDALRQDYLERSGWRVLRFWNNDVVENLPGVIETIVRAASPHPNPLPQAGEGTVLSLGTTLS